MKLPRRQFLHLAAGAAALPAVAPFARAQTYPTRPVRVIVGYPPGGAADVTARLIGQRLSERLGQPFIVENRAGAATNIATEAVAKATPDGYTLLVVDAAPAINTTLYHNLNFVFLRDIAPVACVVSAPLFMVVNPAVPAKTVPEFIAYAKANPRKVNMASNGNGVNRRVHQGRQSASVGRDHGYALGSHAGYPNFERIPAGVRRGRMDWFRRTQGHTPRDHRETKQGDQCCVGGA